MGFVKAYKIAVRSILSKKGRSIQKVLGVSTGPEMINIMQELSRNGNMVLITHDNNVGMQTKRVIRIIDGQISENRGVS